MSSYPEYVSRKLRRPLALGSSKAIAMLLAVDHEWYLRRRYILPIYWLSVAERERRSLATESVSSKPATLKYDMRNWIETLHVETFADKFTKKQSSTNASYK
jgi:hypothetical protein